MNFDTRGAPDGRDFRRPDNSRETKSAWENIDLTKIDWEKMKEKEGVDISFDYHGETFNIRATLKEPNPERNPPISLLQFVIKDARNILAADAILSVRHFQIELGVGVSVSHYRNNYRTGYRFSNADLPPGFGIDLYKKVLEVIPTIVLEYKKPAKHTVHAVPTSGLSIEKWRELFHPVLLERGYSETPEEGENVWTKTYPLET